MILDVIDGGLARALQSESKIGAELDTLADFFNFGTNKPNPLYDKKKNDGLSLDERKALFESYAKDNFEGLLNLYDEGVLFLDDFVNRGLKADLIVNNLKHYGFENPSFATFIARDEGAEQRMFVGSVNENCYRVIHNFIRTQRELRRFEEKYC